MSAPTVQAMATTTPADLIGPQATGPLIAAARIAGVHALISELPEGYATPVGPGGVALTPPQHELLARAARLAADPAVTGPGSDPAGPPRAAAPPADPDLPALGRLLDPGGMQEPLAGLLGSPVDAVRVESVRYKPGDNVVVQYAALTPTGWVTVVAYCRPRAGLEGKHRSPRNLRLAARQVTGPGGTLGFLAEVGALVQVLPLDVRLPLLGEDADRLAERLAKKGIVVGTVEPELLRYWPRRRAVLRLGDHVLKVYRDRADFDDARRALRRSTQLRRVRTPRYEGRLPGQRVTVQEWLPGGPPSLPPAGSAPAGGLLRDLHAEDLTLSRRTTPAHLLAKATARAGFVGHLVPALRPELDHVLTRLATRAPRTDDDVVSHGNFHAGQLLADPVRGLAMVDVDGLSRAAPAHDLTSFAAHLAFGDPADEEVLGSALDALLAGYGCTPPDLEWHLAINVLRRAAVPFRFQDPAWPDAVTELVDLARRVIR